MKLRFFVLSFLIFLLLVLRRPDAVTNPQFWAEDGVVFYASQVLHPGIPTLFETYKAYLHLIPRLAMAFAAPFPAAASPLITNLLALAITAFCCSLFSLNRYRYLVRSDSLRIAVCLVIATAFQANELIGNITCVHCWALLAALLAVAQPYRGKSAWLLAIAALFAGLSDPAVVMLLPLALWLAIRRPDTLPAALAIGLASLAQAAVFLHAGSAERGPGPQDSIGAIAGSSLSALVYRTELVPMFGIGPVMSRPARDFIPVLLITLALSAVWLTTLWWQLDTTKRRILLTAVYLSIASVVMVVAGRSMAPNFLPTGITTWDGERYFLFGSSLFAFLVALSIERWISWKRARALLLIAVFAYGIRGNFRATPFTDFHWNQYTADIDRWRSDRRAGHPTPAVLVPINPGGPWKVRLPAAN